MGEEYSYEVKLDGFRCLAFVDGERGLPAVARPASRSGATSPSCCSRTGATCSTGRSSCATPTDARTSTRSASASTRPPRGSSACRSRRPPATWPSTCSPAVRSRCSSGPSPSVARRSRSCSRAESFAGAPVELMEASDRRGGRPRVARCSAEGAIAKERAAPYRPGERKGMVKVKRVRTIDAVVAGWRPGKEADTVGALILGLYDGADAELRVVGHCSGLHRGREAAAGRLPRALRDRTSAAPPTPAAGAPAGTWSGSPCAPSWSWRSTSTTSPPGASATAPSCGAGARTRTRASAPSISCVSRPTASSRISAMSAAHGVTVAEEEYLQILFWLQEAGLPMTGANVARAMQLSAPTVHEMVGRLERDGYITRDADRTIAFTASRRRARRGDRAPPPPDRALPDRRPGGPLGRGARGGRAPGARHVARARGAHAAPPSATPRPARTATRSSPARAWPACRWPTSRSAPRCGCCASRTRPRICCTTSRPRASSPASRARWPQRDDEEVVLEAADGRRCTVTPSVAETVSVIADPSPPPRTALPEQLVLGQRYGR